MKFVETVIPGVFVIEPEPLEDERGFFARTYCRQEFLAHGLCADFAQDSVSWNRRKGTLRGMHYQAAPDEEAKLVSVSRGAIYDVALDLRPDSPAYLCWVAVELDERNRKALYIPKGCAHGFQALHDDTEVRYRISEPYRPEAARGVRWNDPSFAIDWPLEVAALSARDAAYPDFA